MENLDFSEDEIQQQLEALGYTNIPKHRLREFKRDLDELIRHERSKTLTSSSELTSPRSQNASRGPPAYTKVKVQQGDAAAYSLWSSSQTATSDTGRQVLQPAQPSTNAGRPVCYETFTQPITSVGSRDAQYIVGRRRACSDSYAQHSVALRLRPPAASVRLERETGLPRPSLAASQGSTPDRDEAEAHGRPFIKRKVLRKLRGQVHVCDESTHSEDSGALSGLEDGLGGPDLSLLAPHRPGSAFRDQEDMDSEDTGSMTDVHGSEGEGAFEAYIGGMARCRSEDDIRPRPKSFIRPVLDHPHTRNLKKTDPVAKYFQYKQIWEAFKAPGERDRKTLHQEIREQLAYQPPPPRPRRVLVPNTYVVPTDKKRSALRWEVRHDLAKGLLPPPINYQL